MGDGGTVERLKQFLRELSPEARSLLIAELERSVLRADNAPGYGLVLQELRRIMRNADRPAQRVGNAARFFFRPLEPFLIDDVADHKHPGRVARVSLETLWRWVRRDLLPEETKTFSEEIAKLLLANDEIKVEAITRALQDQAAAKIEAVISATEGDDKAHRRLLAQIGTPRAEQDVTALLKVLGGRDALQSLAGRLPGHIDNLADGLLSNTKAYIDFTTARDPSILVYALLVVMARLSSPWQLIRLATLAADSHATLRVLDTPYSIAVTIVLNDLERMVGELRTDLRGGRGVAVSSLLKSIHDTARGLRTELDLSIDSNWGCQLAGLRGQISDLLKSEIESVPGRVRRLLRPRQSKEIGANSVLDAHDVNELETAIEFVSACRGFASELAINEITQRTFSDLQQYLDTGTRALLDGLRHAGENDRPFRQSQVDAAVRYCAKIFGPEYASLLTKASEVATTAERKAVRA